jgi:hypothetical protein
MAFRNRHLGLFALVAGLFFNAAAVQAASANRPPTISGSPPTSVAAGTAYTFRPSASDPDRWTWPRYTITNKPAWASFSSWTGTLSGTPTTTQAGTTSGIVIRVSDGRLSAALPAFSITVTGGATNRPPSISGSPASSVTAGAQYTFQPSASDPDGQALSWSITNKPAWASFNASTGRLSGTPASSQVGTTTGIVIGVSDGTASASLPAFSLTVNAAANRPPVVSGTPPTSVTVGNAYSFTPTGSDPDGDTLTWSIAAKPGPASFNVTTGRLNWTPSAAGTWSNIVITATDSRGAAVSLPAFSITAVPAAPSGTATLSWLAPTQYTDGSALPASQLGAYRIYRGASAGSLSRIAEVDDGTMSFTVQSLAAGTHYFAVTAVTVGGTESALSAVGSKTIP